MNMISPLVSLKLNQAKECIMILILGSDLRKLKVPIIISMRIMMEGIALFLFLMQMITSLVLDSIMIRI
ncbi:hypothetical protein ES705_24163 [subsurface metagenome]